MRCLFLPDYQEFTMTDGQNNSTSHKQNHCPAALCFEHASPGANGDYSSNGPEEQSRINSRAF